MADIDRRSTLILLMVLTTFLPLLFTDTLLSLEITLVLTDDKLLLLLIVENLLGISNC